MAADRLLGFLREQRSHQALVVDAAKRVVGLITLEDVLGELLGSVPDEFKAPRLLPLRLTDGRVRLPGDLPLERARVWVEGAWPTDDITVGEFIVREAGRMPEPGETLEVCGAGRRDRERRERPDLVGDRQAAAARRGRGRGRDGLTCSCRS